MPPIQAATDWLSFLYSQGPGFALALALCACGYIYAVYRGWTVPGQYYREKVAECNRLLADAQIFNDFAKRAVERAAADVGLSTPLGKRASRRDEDRAAD